MRKTLGWTGLRTSAVALSLAFGAASAARADVISTPATATIDYNSVGQVDTSTGVTGTNVIGYNGISPSTLDSSGNLESHITAPSGLSLGSFAVLSPGDGKTTTYTNVPFKITFSTNTINGQAPSPNDTPIVLTGVINGTVSGASQANLVATFDKTNPPTFRTGDYLNTLTVPDKVALVPFSSNQGHSSVQSSLSVVFSPQPPPDPINTPEPTSIALFLTAIGGLGLRRRLRQASR